MARIRKIIKILALSLIFCLILIAAAFFYYHDLQTTPIVGQKIASSDYKYLYGFYVNSAPNIEGRSYYGSEKAGINIIAFLNPESPVSKDFVNNILPSLQKEYIDAGKAKLIQKNYITLQDIEQKNSRYLYAISLLCVESIKKEAYYPFYFSLFSISSANEIKTLLPKQGIPEKTFNECIGNQDIRLLLEDASEVQRLGLSGTNQRFYIGIGQDYSSLDGIPSYSRLKRELRQYQIMIGD
jgi:hypothetical protein